MSEKFGEQSEPNCESNGGRHLTVMKEVGRTPAF